MRLKKAKFGHRLNEIVPEHTNQFYLPEYLTKLPQIKCQSLATLILDENEIASIEYFGSRTLHTLSINKNKLTSFEGLTSHNGLKTVSAIENELTTLAGIAQCPNI